MTAIDPRPGCMGKTAYPSPQQAHAALDRMHPTMFRHRWKKWRKPEPQEIYHCETCGGWHMGTKDRRK